MAEQKSGTDFSSILESARFRAAAVLVLLLAGGLFRVAGVAEKRRFFTDEPVSYLIATGHAEEWERVAAGDYPSGKWVRAAEWKRLVRIKRPFCFDQIRRESAHFDNHPPLYAWLLHLWCLAFGTGMRSGPALNVLLSLASTLALLGMARCLLKDFWEAFLVCWIWALSPSVISIAFESRSYELTALWTILFVWRSVRFADLGAQPNWRDRALIVLIAAAGMLTHYYFAFVVAGCGVYALARLMRRDRRRFAEWAALAAAGCVALLVLHPEWRLSFIRQRRDWETWSLGAFTARLHNVVWTLAGFIGYSRAVLYAGVAAASAGALALAGLALTTPRNLAGAVRERSRGWEALFFCAWIGSAIIALYLALFSHESAMRDKYMAMAWPFCAFIPVFALRFLPRGKAVATALLMAVILAGAFGALQRQRDLSSGPDPAPILRAADTVLVDDVDREFLPRVIYYAPEDRLVYVADSEHLLAHPSEWTDSLGHRSIYVSHLRRKKRMPDQERILSLIRGRRAVVPVEGGILGLGGVFVSEADRSN